MKSGELRAVQTERVAAPLRSATGIHYDVSFEEYLAIPAINKSGLDTLARSPLHYWSKYLDPNRQPDKDTPAKRFGRAIHHAVLEPSEFLLRWVEKPIPENFPSFLNTADQHKQKCLELGLPISGSKAELKKRILGVAPETLFFDDAEAVAEKYETLHPDDYAACEVISNRVRESPSAAEVFPKGRSEVTIVWRDERIGGHLCKARLDWLADDYSIITDLKSAEDASPIAFGKSCATYNYHRQADWYLTAVEKATGVRPGVFAFAVYEKEPPYAAGFYYASQIMLELGRMENAELLARYDACKMQDRWPGYAEELQSVGFPAWRIKQPDFNQQPMESY